MASFKKSFEGLKSTSHSAVEGVTEAAVQAAQDSMQQVAELSKETTSTATQEPNRQTQAAIEKVADKATETIKEYGQKLEGK